MRKLVLASLVALLVGLSVGAKAHAWPNIDLLPNPNLEDLNDFPSPSPDFDPSVDETLSEARRVSDWDFDDDGVMDEAERSFAFERDTDADGVLDYQDPDQSDINYMLRLPGGYDYDDDGLFDDDPRDMVYGKDRVPDPDPDLELQYQYQQTTIQEEPAVEETTAAEETTSEETTSENTQAPDNEGSDDEGVGWGGFFLAAVVFGIWLYFRER